MQRFIRITPWLLAAAGFAAAGSASAAVTVYTSLASFQGAVGARGVDTFDNLALGADPTGARQAGAFGYVASVVDGKAAPDSFFTVGSPPDIWLSTNSGVDTIVFSGFSASTKGIGANFFGTNVDGAFLAGQPLRITLTDAAGDNVQTLVGAATTSFLGFVTTSSLVSMSVQLAPNASVNAWPTVNNLTLAAAVPEPGSYALMLGGLLALAALARRRLGGKQTR